VEISPAASRQLSKPADDGPHYSAWGLSQHAAANLTIIILFITLNFDRVKDKGEKVNERTAANGYSHLIATGRHLPYGITQCYNCHPTQVNAPRLNPSK